MSILSRVQTERSDLGRSRLVTEPVPTLGAGEVLFEIDCLALTANNITYAAFGDVPALRYWSFFPTGEAGWGHMPAWGFAEVAVSKVAGIEPGERFYGFWPIATHLVMKPVRVSERGFYDGVEHRLGLTSAYNQYQRVTTDAAYREQDEDYQMLLRPLFITSFMLADFLQDREFFGAKRAIFSSASSKTAYGTAFCLEQTQGLERVALTSASNRAFVEGLGCYDRSLEYSELGSLDPQVPSIYVDFSGDSALRLQVHQHCGEALLHDCYAGSAQSHEHLGSTSQGLPGPKPRAYFAPEQIKKRNADWGPAEVTRRFNEVQLRFIERVQDERHPWIRVREHAGLEAARSLISDLVSGAVSPLDGHVIRLREPKPRARI